MRAVNVQSVERAAKLLAADSDYMHLAHLAGTTGLALFSRFVLS